jgi:hypothetical protein
MREEVRRSTMMTIQEAIHKAVEGGYHIYGSDGMDTDYAGATHDYTAWTRKDNASSFIVPTEETFLDPQFWQALGRALGWSEACDLVISCRHAAEEGQSCRGYYWMYQWHCFIQALADGKTPGAFFAHLISSQRMSRGRKNQPKTGKAHPHPSCLFVITTETRQRSQHICEEAARAQQKAQDALRTAQFSRQRRQAEHVERALWREPCDVQWSAPVRV